MAVTMKVCIIWMLLTLSIVSAWPFEKFSVEPGPIPESALSLRDTPEFSPSTGCKSECKSLGCAGCGSKRSLSWPLEIIGTNEGIADNVTLAGHPRKRMLAPYDEGNVDEHVLSLANGRKIKSIVSQNSKRYISFSVQERFADHPDDPLIIGTARGFLTGCTVLTVVSSRAVYMAHFYQDLGFVNDEPNEGDPAVDFQGNVLNLISGRLTGTPDEVNAAGPGIDPSLFTMEGDLPYASVMTPRHNNRGKTAYFPKMVGQIESLVKDLIPGCRIDRYKYFSEYDYGDSARGVSVFEYDADADGQGHGDWRLWYETRPLRGRLLGQNLVPRA